MKNMNYVVWQEEKYFVSLCLNSEVSSFGSTIDESVKNLKEAVELYYENENEEIIEINSVMMGREPINA